VKRVLLTGGGGAIGVHVIAHILENTDWEVVVLDSFRHKGYKDRIYQMLKEVPAEVTNVRVQIIQHDLVCPVSPYLARLIGQIDYILHLAAISDVFWSVNNEAYTIHNNVMSTLTMLEYAKTIPHEAFIYFSTDEVYGPVQDGEAHAEWSPHRPSNAYSASKAASEDIAYSYWRAGDVRLILTNTMNNYGEMQAPSKFPAMIQNRLQDGEKITVHGNEGNIGSRFYIHSRNTADALLFILQNLPAHVHQTGEIDDPDRYHIVGEIRLNNLQLATHIAELMGKHLEYELVDFHRDNPAHDIHYGLQDNKLRAAGWQQPKTFDESMKETIAWQQRHPDWL